MIRIGVVGYGYWGPNLVRNIVEAPGCELKAVCDARPERLALLAKRHPHVRAVRDCNDLLCAPDVDAVAIATPATTHYDLAIRALQNDKHVLLEKPLALRVSQAEALMEEAESRNLVLMVDHTFVYTAAVRKIRDLIAGGELGEIYYYDSIRINLGIFQHDVNVLWDLAVHDLSILDYLLGGGVSGISAFAVRHLRNQPEDLAYLTVLFANNVTAHFHVGWLAPVKIRRTIIAGSRKMVVYDDLEPSEKIKIYDKGVNLACDEAKVHELLVSYRAGEIQSPHLDGTEALYTEVLHFLDCIRKQATPITDGRAGLRVVRMLEAATESSRQRGRVVDLHAPVGSVLHD